MAKWEQHYYTWSTSSLSGSKVGLGIVADSKKHDREYMRMMEVQGARSEVCREEENLTVERFCYSEELPGYIRTGATPCQAGADLRNNKFVHIYSLKTDRELLPEEYLAPLSYKKQWDGTSELPFFESFPQEGEAGREGILGILYAFGLQSRLPELFCRVYRCLLSGEKPLSIVDRTKPPEQFGQFSRQMMLLVHSILPVCLRKEADYVSYAAEESQEAHFLFRKESCGRSFDLRNSGWEEETCAPLEQKFYLRLSESFLKNDSSFQQFLESMDQFLKGLSDKRNLLEKCIYAFMSTEAGREEKKEDFFAGAERLMYWARKDGSLLPALKEAIKNLDFRHMDGEELVSYAGLMLTGAGGRTKELACGELCRMLHYFYEAKDQRFALVLDRMSRASGAVYGQLITDGDQKFRQFVAITAYGMYRKAKSKEKRQKLEALGKMADLEVFVGQKQEDVRRVLGQAGNFQEFAAVAQQMDLGNLEDPIRKMAAQMALNWFGQEKESLEPGELPTKEAGRALLLLGEKLGYGRRMREELSECYEETMAPVFASADAQALVHMEFPDGREEQEIYRDILEKMALARYLDLIHKDRDSFYRLDLSDWIGFVMRVSIAREKQEKRKAREAIALTREAVLDKKELPYLARANGILEHYGALPICCPGKLWDEVTLDDFSGLYDKIEDIALVKCGENPMYRAMELFCHFVRRENTQTDEKKLRALLRDYKETGEQLLCLLASLWGAKESLEMEFFYPLLRETFGREEAGKLMMQAAGENDRALKQWKSYERELQRKEERAMEPKEKRNPMEYVRNDILSESLWSVVLGTYGYLFVRFRELKLFQEGYRLSIQILIGLAICYGLLSVFGRRERRTPTAAIYVVGMGLLLMNLALSLERQFYVTVLFAVSTAVGLVCKIIDLILHRNE